MNTKPKQKCHTTIRVKVDDDWIEYVTRGNTDMFEQAYHSGYWAYGVENNGTQGWLVYEYGDDDIPDEHEDAVRAWLNHEELPARYHRFDRKFAFKSFAEGVKRNGVNWLENADGPEMDSAIQRALFGVEKYG